MPAVTDEVPPDAPRFRYVKVRWPRKGIAEVALHRPPVNAMNLEVWEELENAFMYLEGLFPHHTRAVVLASALPQSRAVFTAGNDVTELHAPSTTRQRFNDFWVASVRALTKLYASPLTTVSAVRGACPAGGCVLALCCDARLVTRGTKIGLNESALGIPVPEYWAKLFLTTANRRSVAEGALFTGRMLNAEEALQLALVDCIVDDDVRHEAALYAEKLVMCPSVVGRAKTKSNIRNEFAAQWLAFGPKEARIAWTDLSKKETADALGAVLKRLSRSKM